MAARSGSLRVPVGALVALALAVLFAGFLLGRSSPVASPAPTSAPPTLAAERTAPPPAGPTVEPPPALTASGATLVAEPPHETQPAIALPAAAPPALDGRGREEVARYFDEADAIEARAKYWSDPQALARTILEQASSGNTSGFDDLIRAQTSARDELGRMSVPAECAEHHRRSVAVMTEGLGLLERVKSALASGDLGALDGLPEAAQRLEREAKAVDEIGRTLRPR